MSFGIAEKVELRLNAVLEKCGEKTTPLATYMGCVGVLQEGVQEMKNEVERNSFVDKAEEIQHFKEDAPRMHGRLFFYMKLVQIESWRQYYSDERFAELLREELRETEAFLEKHAPICEYYYQAREYWDDFLFTRRGRGEWSSEEVGTFIDDHFTIGAYWLSRINANTQLRNWVLAEMEEAGRPAAPPGQPKKLICYAKPVEVVEVFKALHLDGWFGKVSFKEVIAWAREILNMRIGDQDQILQEISIRKISRTKCLDRAKEVLESWMNDKL